MSSPAEASARLTADDRFEIHELMARYAYCDDNGDAETWASLFTIDGTFIGLGKPPVVGRAQLLDFAKRRWAEQPEVRTRRHWVSNITVEATPGGAKAASAQMSVDRNADGTHRMHKLTGKRDELRRVDGRWRFHVRRTVEMIDRD